MFSLLTFFLGLIFNLGMSKKDLLVQVSLQQKEIEILKRHHRRRRVRFRHSDRVVFSILNSVAHLKERLSLVKPETVLGWQRQLIKHFWTFKKNKRVGRPPVSNDIKQLILAMKNDNLYWGYKKIQGELLKLNIDLDKNTIRNILSDFRRKGKIKQSLSWKQFLSQQIHSLYAADFFTVDTIMNDLHVKNLHSIFMRKSRFSQIFKISPNILLLQNRQTISIRPADYNFCSKWFTRLI